MLLRRLVATAVAGTLSLALSAAQAETLEIAGSTSVQKAIIDPVNTKAKEVTGIDIKMLGVGSVKGLSMLVEGKVAVAAISEALPDAIAALKKSGATTIPGNLQMTTILNDKIIPIVHPSNKVANLSKTQVVDIISGKTTNWKELGGEDTPIVVIAPAAGSGTRAVIDKQLLGGNALSSAAKEIRTSSGEVTEVAREKGAIGLVGSGTAESAKSKIKEIVGFELVRPLGLVTIGAPSADAQKLIEFLKSPVASKLYIQ